MSYELVNIDLEDARRFVARHHRHNPKITGWKVGVGLANGELRGVAVLSRPVSKEVQKREPRTAEIIRTCTLGDKNANSRLYGAMARAAAALGYTAVITYTRPEESGASLLAAGFVRDEGEHGSRPGQQWHPRQQSLLPERDTSGPKIRWRRQLRTPSAATSGAHPKDVRSAEQAGSE